MMKLLARRCWIAMLLLATAVTAAEVPPKLPKVQPEQAGMDSQRLAHIDQVVAEGLAKGQMPGCVVAVGYQGKITWLKAYGYKQVKPVQVPMTVDTVFDGFHYQARSDCH